MIPGTTAIVIGNVGNVRDHTDRRGRESVLVELTTPAGQIVLIIPYSAGRVAARRWKRGDRITAWGHVADVPDLGQLVSVRAHTVQRLRPGHFTTPLDPVRRTPPRRRPGRYATRQEPT